MLQLTIQLKEEFADKTFTPQETGYWLPAMQASAIAVQQLNVLFAEQMIHGPLKSNPEAMVYHPPTTETDPETGEVTEIAEYYEGQVEGFLGDVNTPPNEFGVVTVVIENYAALKIPYLPLEVPFSIYLGDTSEKKEVGTDEEGNPIYETVYAGEIQ